MVTLAGGFMILLDVSIVTVAIPSIEQGLGTSASGVQWVVSGYPLTFGLALVAGGRLGDAFGRRNMYLFALSGFVATSVFAGLAPTLTVLVIARLLQGLVAGLVTPQNGGLIQDLFRGAERGRAFGLLGATIGVSTAAGPVIGGFILGVAGEPDGWRWVFLVNLPFGLLTIALALLLVPRTPKRATRADPERAAGVWTDEHGDPREERARDLRAQEGRRRTEARGAPSGARQSDVDIFGILLLGLTVLCLMCPIVLSEADGIRRFWWLFVVAVPLGWAFLRWERRRVRDERSPLVDMRLFTATPGYPSGAALATVYFCGFSGIWLVFAVYFQSDLGLSPLESGLAVTPFSLGSAVSSWLAGRLVARYGRWVTITGLVLMVVGLGVVALLGFVVDGEPLLPAIALPLLVAGVGGGAVISPNTTMTLACVPPGMSGVASGVLQTGQRLGSAVGTAVLAAVFHAASGTGAATGFSFAMLAATVMIVAALALAFAERNGRIRKVVPATSEPAGV